MNAALLCSDAITQLQLQQKYKKTATATAATNYASTITTITIIITVFLFKKNENEQRSMHKVGVVVGEMFGLGEQLKINKITAKNYEFNE